MAGKYGRLYDHLCTLRTSEWQANFAEIEDVLGMDLPPSAKRHSAWWSNGGHPHARAWMDAGFRTCELSVSRRTVVFRREVADRSHEPTVRRAASVARPPRGSEHPIAGPPIAQEATVLPLCGHDFAWCARIEPDTGSDGRPLEFMPQKEYAKANEKPLNKHGSGPFCRFSVPHLPEYAGLYAVTVARRLAYVGIARKSLRQRWSSSGYAEIQPVNCYRGGQSTNCKINHAILLAVRDGQIVELWTRRESDPRPLEARLIGELNPPWNDQR